MPNKTIVIQPVDGDIEKKVLAAVIVGISQDIRKLYESGLNKRAVVALLKDSTGYTKGQIEAVLHAIVDLRAMYCR